MSVRRVAPWVGLVGWSVLVVAARWVGVGIAETPRVAVGAAPVVGRWMWSPDGGLVWPMLIGVLTVAFGPHLARRLAWRWLLGAVVVAGTLWAVALAATEGTGALTEPLETRYEYMAVIPAVDEVGVATFVSTYTERLGDYPTHVKGHPPGATLVFVALDRVGLGGSGWAAALVIVVGASAGAAVLVTLRQLAGDATARRAAPFLVVLPGAIWIGTSADAMFAGVIAWGVAAAAVACRSDGTRQQVLAGLAGVGLGLSLLLTYGAVPLLLIPTAVVVATRAWPVVVPAAAGAVAVAATAALAGFWWLDGVEATRMFYEAGVSQRRDYGYFVFLGNPAAFALATGPAVAAAVVGLRVRRVWVVVGAALAAVAVADVSGLSKGEVERIWLPFVPWVAAATVDLGGRSSTRAWLALQVTAALVVETWLSSPW